MNLAGSNLTRFARWRIMKQSGEVAVAEKKKKRPWRAKVRREAKKARLAAERLERGEDCAFATSGSPVNGGNCDAADGARRKRRRRKSGKPTDGSDGQAEAEKARPSKADSLEERLNGSRFRFINEQLYTKRSQEAVELFRADPAAFELYHRGYEHQLAKWPSDPLRIIVAELESQATNEPGSSGVVVVDVGCGRARLAEELSTRFTVHSFDLVAANERVTVADMASLPLPKSSVDVAVYCLSLMGTNLAKFMREANRILKRGGELKIAEVLSRFTNPNAFVASVEKMGFKLRNKRVLRNFFLLANFEKAGRVETKRPLGLALKPCLYKRR